MNPSAKFGLVVVLSITWTVHLSFVIEQSALSGGEEEHCADVDEVLRTGNKDSSDEPKGNSAILSIRGALTETSGESMWQILTL